MTKREIKRRARLAVGQILFNSHWAGLFDATGLPEEVREAFLSEVYDIGWRLQQEAIKRAPLPSPASTESTA